MSSRPSNFEFLGAYDEQLVRLAASVRDCRLLASTRNNFGRRICSAQANTYGAGQITSIATRDCG